MKVTFSPSVRHLASAPSMYTLLLYHTSFKPTDGSWNTQRSNMGFNGTFFKSLVHIWRVHKHLIHIAMDKIQIHDPEVTPKRLYARLATHMVTGAFQGLDSQKGLMKDKINHNYGTEAVHLSLIF